MYRKIIKIFLGSPGDLEDERKAAKRIVDEENSNHANALGYHIDLVGWEDTVSQRQRAQDAINVDLDQCMYFIGLMWKKWGTPPGPEGHPYSSGFEEEYRRSVSRHESTGKPEISLLFKNIPKDDLNDVGKQLQKVLDFREEMNRDKKQYYQKFQDLNDFEQKFRAIVAKFLRDQKIEEQDSETFEPQKPKKAEKKGNAQEKNEVSKQLFEGSARTFIDDFIIKEDAPDAYNSIDAARFRLLASTLSDHGNDNYELGTHDANLIYRYFRSGKLSGREKRGLVSTGLENLKSTTVPIWHWLFDSDFNLKRRLPILTAFGGDKKQRNTFKLLEKLSISPEDFEGYFNKDSCLKHWFSKDKSDELVIAALDYLGILGDKGLRVDWSDLISSSEANISQAAVRARAQILAQTNTTEALCFVAQHETADLGRKVAEELLKNISTIETAVLCSCLKNRTSVFLKEIATELTRRSALTKSDAQLLCESSDADIRLIGVKTLSKLVPAFKLSDARKLLVKPRSLNTSSLAQSNEDKDYPGEHAFEKFKSSLFGELSYEELLELQKDESFYSSGVTLALYSSYFKKVKVQLERDLTDGFEKFCTDRNALQLGNSLERSDYLFNYIRNDLLWAALEIYCSKATHLDIATVRKVVDDYEIKFSIQIAEFFAKHGEWEDTIRILKLSEHLNYGFGLTLLSSKDHFRDYQVAANTILKLSSKRIADAWKLKLLPSVREQLVIEMPKKLFIAFNDQNIIDMLLIDSDVVREVVALKAVQCLPKNRLAKILTSYYGVDGSYFYNVIFWLDLGVSADRVISQKIASKELSVRTLGSN
ncbi:DUF4062 domain-containing protein [Flavobacterium sp. W21_SRS_FM6]|uniref:DUF4062 domain-containing protein n=1 Tax=Flavobacterium sp. W21_SRS_FM6 TaxID=3240268 RepID=UPI003F8FE1E5